MEKIGFIVLDTDMLHRVTDILSNHPNILYKVGLVTKAEQMAEEFIAKSIDIIIARGATARAIAGGYPELTVVEVPVTAFDWLRAITAAKRHGPKIAVVSLTSIDLDISWLGPILDVSLENFPVRSYSDVEKSILTAASRGFDCIVCGGVSAKLAQQYNVPCELVTMSQEGVLQAVQQANQISLAMERTKRKHSIMTTVFDNSTEGIITIDEKGSVTSFNTTAAKLTKFRKSDVLDSDIRSFWPELNLPAVIDTRKAKLGQILAVAGNRIICDKSPIVMNGAVVGAAAIFNEVGRIEQMGATIRRKMHAHGHTASYTFADILGDSRELRELIVMAKDFAVTDENILLLGETGTGKELFAHSVHNAAKRAVEPFVAINCASLPYHILESELFGYVGGAFTGANREGKAGLFEIAHKGTLFLDEIGEMDYTLQGYLLRFLQDKTIRRLGSEKNITVDVRIIAATNKDLDQLIAERMFRSDLYYRLNVFSLILPPLRERKGDIPLLANSFIRLFARSPVFLSDSAVKRLQQHTWPGNIRELENLAKRCVATIKKESLNAKDIDELLAARQQKTIKQQVEMHALRDAMAAAKGKHGEAARILQIDRSTLWRRLKRYRLN
jgi:transcriptional regulator with PAS, ATPase and Fis domain